MSYKDYTFERFTTDKLEDVSLAVCKHCSCVVYDMPKHDQFHEELKLTQSEREELNVRRAGRTYPRAENRKVGG